MGVVGSEVHFICECPLYKDFRHGLNNKYIFPVNATMSTNCKFPSTFQAWDRRTDIMYNR